MSTKQDSLIKTDCPVFMFRKCELFGAVILITNKTVDKKSSHNPYMQDYARFFVQFLIGF